MISWWDYFIYGQEPIVEEDEEANIDQEERPKEIRSFKVTGNLFLKRISDTLFKKSRNRKSKERKSSRDGRSSVRNQKRPRVGRSNKIYPKMVKSSNKDKIRQIVDGTKSPNIANTKDIKNFMPKARTKKLSVNLKHNITASKPLGNNIFVYDSAQELSNFSSSQRGPNPVTKDKILKTLRVRNTKILNRTFGEETMHNVIINPASQPSNPSHGHNPPSNPSDQYKPSESLEPQKCTLCYENDCNAVLME